MQTWLIFRLKIPGFHQWSDAPKKYEYLKNLHRHEFYIQVEIRVDENRGYEFIEMKSDFHIWLLQNLGDYTYKDSIYLDERIKKQSVEGLAEYIIKYITETYNHKGVKVTVEEDHENGARVEYWP